MTSNFNTEPSLKNQDEASIFSVENEPTPATLPLKSVYPSLQKQKIKAERAEIVRILKKTIRQLKNSQEELSQIKQQLGDALRAQNQLIHSKKILERQHMDLYAQLTQAKQQLQHIQGEPRSFMSTSEQVAYFPSSTLKSPQTAEEKIKGLSTMLRSALLDLKATRAALKTALQEKEESGAKNITQDSSWAPLQKLVELKTEEILSLQSRLDQLQSEEKKWREKEFELQQLRNEQEALQTHIQELEEDYFTLKNQLKDAKELSAAEQGERSRLNHLLQDKERVHLAAINELQENHHAEIQALQKALQSWMEQFENLKAATNNKEHLLNEAKLNIQEELQKGQKKYEEDSAKQTEKLTQLEVNLATKIKELELLQKQKGESEKKNLKDLQNLQQEISFLQDKLLKNEQSIKQIQISSHQQIQQLDNEIEQLQLSFGRIKEENTRFLQAAAFTDAMLDKQSAHIQELKEALQKKEEESNARKEEALRISEQEQKTLQAFLLQKNELDTLIERTNALHIDLQSLQDEKALLEEKNRQFIEEKQEVLQIASRQKLELDALQERNESLQMALQMQIEENKEIETLKAAALLEKEETIQAFALHKIEFQALQQQEEALQLAMQMQFEEKKEIESRHAQALREKLENFELRLQEEKEHFQKERELETNRLKQSFKHAFEKAQEMTQKHISTKEQEWHAERKDWEMTHQLIEAQKKQLMNDKKQLSQKNDEAVVHNQTLNSHIQSINIQLEESLNELKALQNQYLNILSLYAISEGDFKAAARQIEVLGEELHAKEESLQQEQLSNCEKSQEILNLQAESESHAEQIQIARNQIEELQSQYRLVQDQFQESLQQVHLLEEEGLAKTEALKRCEKLLIDKQQEVLKFQEEYSSIKLDFEQSQEQIDQLLQNIQSQQNQIEAFVTKEAELKEHNAEQIQRLETQVKQWQEKYNSLQSKFQETLQKLAVLEKTKNQYETFLGQFKSFINKSMGDVGSSDIPPAPPVQSPAHRPLFNPDTYPGQSVKDNLFET